MRLNTPRWILVTLLGGLLGLSLALPDWARLYRRGEQWTANSGRYGTPAALYRATVAEQRRLLRLRAEAARAFVRQSLVNVPRAADTATVAWAPGSVPATSALLRAVIDSNVRSIGDSVARLRARAHRDGAPVIHTTLIEIPVALAEGDGPLGRRNNSVVSAAWVVLPDSLGGSTCAVAFKQGAFVNAMTKGNPLGPCFWYAAFGAPGSTMREFMEAQAFQGTARMGSYRADSLNRRGVWVPDIINEPYMMGQLDTRVTYLALTCVARGGAACSRAAFDAYLSSRASWLHGTATVPWNDPLTWLQRVSVPMLATDLGAVRFQRLWASDRPFPEAFADAAGESFDDYVRHAFMRSFGGGYHPGPWPSGATFLLFLIVAGILLGLLVVSDRRPTVA